MFYGAYTAPMSPGILGGYLVAFSLAGEQRDKVRAIAEEVRQALGDGKVFLDEWYEELVGGLEAYANLQALYGYDCVLAVVCVSQQAGQKPWTRAEQNAILARHMRAQTALEKLAILPIRVGDGEIPGFPETAIIPDVRDRSPLEAARLIVHRLKKIDPSIAVNPDWDPPAPTAAAAPLPNPVITDGSVEFIPLEYKHLKKVCVVAQSLDNQWVPRGLLQRMLSEGLALKDVEAGRERFVRNEYMRALINAEQVVINRAYLYNNDVVARDYRKRGPNRDAFKHFLSTGVIVPFLFNETSPIDEPAYRANHFDDWKHLSQELRMQCVRLSWNDDNRSKIDRLLAARFHNFPRTAMDRDVDVFLDHLALPASARSPLKRRLREMSNFSADFADQDKKIAREDLYKQFVVADGTSPAEGKYDKSKVFAAEIKQLLDLCYNVNLPDALGRYALTPFDSLPRAALQDWQVVREAPVQVDQLIVLLQRAAFDILQRQMYVASFGDLTLADVQALRKTDEWQLYMQSLDELILHPLSFAEGNGGAANVYSSYAKLMRVMTDYLSDRQQEAWQPVITVEVEMAGKRLTMTWTDEGKRYGVDGSLSDVFLPGEAPVRARLSIRDVSVEGKQADLATNVDFLRGHVENAKEQWTELVRKVEEFHNIQLLPAAAHLNTARLNHPEAA